MDARQVKAADRRRRELAAIHSGKKQLQMDDATYRMMLLQLTGARSSADLDEAGRRLVIDHMRRLGFSRVNAPPAATADDQKPRVPADRQALMDKIAGLLAGRPWNYARAMAKRMFKVDRLEWADASQLRSLVAALEYDRRRREAKRRCAAE